MEPTTVAIIDSLQAYIFSAYPALYREGVFFVLTMTAACIVIPLFTVWILNRQDRRNAEKDVPCKAYTHRGPAKPLHFIVAVALPITALRKLYLTFRNLSADILWLVGLTVLLLLLAAWAARRLWKWRVSGIFAAGGYILCYAALEQYRCFRSVANTLEVLAQWPLMVQYTWYMEADYQVTWAMASGLLALAALVFLAVYCYRRRFLFLPGRLDSSFCANCGQVISGDGDFCTNCGQPLPSGTVPVRLAVVSLDKRTYCRKCGKPLVKSACLVCDKGKSLTDILKKAGTETRDEVKSTLRTVIASALVILVVVVIPNFLSPLQHAVSGSARVHNAFAEQLMELMEDPALSSDAEWLAGFDSAMDALYAVEARWIYVKPRSVPSGDLLALGAYSEASFRKMELLEQMRDIVHSGRTADVGGPSVLLNALQYTAQLQFNAYQYRYVLTDSLGPLEKVEHGCLNGARAILGKANTEWVSVAVLTVCVLLFLWMLNSVSISGVTELELRLQSVRLKTDVRSKKYAVGAPPAVASALYRTFVAGKAVWLGLLRVGNELWALVVQLLGAIILLFLPFRWRTLRALFLWVLDGLRDGPHTHPEPSAVYQRRQRNATGIAMGVLVLIFTISCGYYGFLNTTSAETDKQVYLAAAKAAVSDYARPIADAVADMQTAGMPSDEDLQQLYNLLSAQAEADRAILDMDQSALEALAELHAGLCSLCTDDLATLERIMTSLEMGETPSLELLVNYINLRSENYLWVTEQLFLAYLIYGIENIS